MSAVSYNSGGDGSIISPNVQYERTQLFLARAKLKASSRTSALLSGFAMIAMVELNLKDVADREGGSALLIVFGVCTVILVSVHLLALMISTCLLPHVEVAAGMAQDTNNSSAIHHMLPQHHPTAAALIYQQQQQELLQNQNLPHINMKNYIELAWICSTVVGIMLFLAEIGLIVWVQFSGAAAIVATCVLVPIVIIFLGVIFKFYQRVVNSRIKTMHYWLEQSKHFNDNEDIANGQQSREDQRTENGVQII